MPKKQKCRVVKETDSYVVKVCTKERASKFPKMEKFEKLPPLTPLPKMEKLKKLPKP